jgi:hypothetical protein
MNGGSGGGSTPVVSVASLNNQTILYNFSSSQEATITGLTLTNNNWGINVVEEWNSGSGDIYFNSCSLLLHFSGSNGSTTITDNSKNNITVTSVNGAAISTAQSKFGGTSLLLDGTNDYLSIPDNEVLELGTNNLTWEMWIKTTSSVQYATLYCREPSSFGSGMWTLMINNASSTAGDIALYLGDLSGAVPLLLTTGVSIRDDVWHHIAIVRNGSAWACYVDGTSRATGTYSGGIGNISAVTLIGADQNVPGRNFAGYIDELRITNGVARYTASFATQSIEFPNQLPQYETKYVGLIGGLNDTGSDYGIQKLDDTSLKIRKMSVSGTPVSGSPFLSASVDRVYVNVLNYSNVSVGSTLLGQTFTAVGSTSSYALSRSVVNAYEIVVAVDGAVQSFNNAYSVTSSTINFTENIPSGSLVDIRFLTTPNVNSASYATTSSNIFGGTRNYIPLWSGTTTLSSSIMYQSGSNIGIGTINPVALLSISSSTDDIRINNGSGVSSIRIYGYNQAGPVGFTGFLELKNAYSASTNPNKFFRLSNIGELQIINSAYLANIFNLTDAGVLSTPGGGTSDVRKKQNVEYIIDDATPIINQFKPVVFEFIEHSGVKRHGFLAQDVLTFKPDLVLGDGDKTDGTYGLDYDGILSLTVKSLQEANKKINDLESAVNILIEEVNNLKTKIGEN